MKPELFINLADLSKARPIKYKEDMRPKLHKFDPVIYPRKLWVVFSYEDVVKNFTYRDDETINIPEDGRGNHNKACVLPVIQKKTGHIGVVVIIWHNIAADDIAHESVHVASSIFDDLGMSMGFDGSRHEHFAYLVGWAAGCIEKAIKTNSAKKDAEKTT